MTCAVNRCREWRMMMPNNKKCMIKEKLLPVFAYFVADDNVSFLVQSWKGCSGTRT